MARTTLTNLRLFDGTGSPTRDGASIVIEDGAIASVGAGRPGGAGEVVDLGGATVLPGIVNGTDYMTMKQVQQAYYDIYRQSPQLQLLRCVRSALVLLSQGVTTTVDIGAIDRVNLTLRNGISMGMVVGPRIVTSGTPIEPRFQSEGTKTPGMTVDAHDAAGVRRHAQALVEAGVDFITVKIDRRDFKTQQVRSFTVPEIAAAKEVATAAGKRLHILARDAGDIRTAVEAHPDSLSPVMSLADVPELATEIARQGIFVISSVASWPRGPMANTERDKKHRQSIGLLVKAGAKVVPAIDLYGTNPVDELVALTELGLSRTDALVAATRTAAQMLRLDGEIGTVVAGMRADLVVVDGDPTQDLEALRRVRWTIHDGVRYEASQLEGVVGSSTTIAA